MLRRWWRLAAVVLLLAPVPASAQVDEPDERVYSFFSLLAAADGMTAEFRIEGFLPIDEFVGLSSVTSEANLTALRANSLAAMPDPGDFVLTLPGTLSALGGVSGLPAYPAAASADHPDRPEDEVVFAPDAGLGAGRLRATAAKDRAAATAATGDLVDTVGLLPSFSIGSVKTSATSERVRPGTIEAVATSTLTDVRLSGGLLRIAEVTSQVTVRAVDEEFSAEVSEISVSGVELAGTRVGISEDGIVGLGQPVALAPTVDVLREPLDDAGLRVYTTPGSTEVGDGEASAVGGSLVIEIPVTVQGFPGTFSLSMAPAKASVQAVTGAAPSPLDFDGGGGAVSAESGSVASGAPAVSGSTGGAPTSQPTTTGTSPSPAAEGGTELVALPAPVEVADWDVRRLYAWMAWCGVLMLLAGPVAERVVAGWAHRSDLRPFWRW